MKYESEFPGYMLKGLERERRSTGVMVGRVEATRLAEFRANEVHNAQVSSAIAAEYAYQQQSADAFEQSLGVGQPSATIGSNGPAGSDLGMAAPPDPACASYECLVHQIGYRDGGAGAPP